MTTSAKLSQKSSVNDVLTDAVRARQTTAQATKQQTKETAVDQRFAQIANNTFYKVMFAAETKPEEKRAQITALLTFEGTKEEARERIKEFELFKEYLQSERESMAQEIIRLTDTETFSELKAVYDDLNNRLIEFDQHMKPLTDIIDAVYTLRTNGMTMDAFQEIINDRKREANISKQRQDKRDQFDTLQDNVRSINADIAALREKRGLFGLGGITQAAREEIARKEARLTEIGVELSTISTDLDDLNKQTVADSALGEFAEQKNKLRELLDISTDDHKQRQRDLVDAALNFVNTAKDRVGSVRQHLSLMNDQIENLGDANGSMSTIYAVLGEGIKEAEKNNQSLRGQLEAPAGEEDLITKMAREQKKMAVEQHITMLDASAVDTMATYADLTSGAVRIKTMKDAVDQQSIRARTMHSQGISGVADRLSVVLQAVSSAALGEASAMAKDTLQAMAENTNKVAQKESIRIAMGISDQNADLAKAIDDLGSYGEVVRAATDITRSGLEEMRGKLNELKTLAETVQGDVHDAIAVTAEVGKGTKQAAPAPQAPKSPFNLGGN